MVILIPCAFLYAEGLKDEINLSYGYYADNGAVRVSTPTISILKKVTDRFLIGVKMQVDAITAATISGGPAKTDAVTSASGSTSGSGSSTVTSTPKTKLFDDVRYSPAIFTTYSDGDNAITLGGYYSTENDYTGRSFYVNYIRQLNDQNTALGVGLSQSFDKWRPIISRELSRYSRDETKIDLSVSQILSQTFTAQMIYSYMYTSGFLCSPYEYLTPPGFLVYESYPSNRSANALTLKLVKLIDDPTAVHFSYRLFKDNWDILSHTFDLELYRDLSKSFTIGAKYRFYTQSKADFTKPLSDYVMTDQYVAVDYRESAFSSNTIGIMAIVKPSTTETGLIDFNKVKIKGAVNYYWTSPNDYINNWYGVHRLQGIFTSLSINYEF